MDWLQPVDLYCERTSAAFWAEPVNTLTNIAFVLAALWGARTARARSDRDPLVWALIVLAAAVGVGSFLFHTIAERWAELADTLPIWAFVALFIYVAIARMSGRKPHALTAVALAAMVAAVAWSAAQEGAAPGVVAPPGPLNGSGQYAPAVIALAVFAAVSWRRHHPMRVWIAAATATFCLSLVFRTIDPAICSSFPLGTHFLWHLCNALMIGLLLQVILRGPRHTATPARIC
ncbi:MAG: hypothetical protein GC186_13880 [Rhodobacteraceae bacterium]|nr:hypothetical protein [Paracoccaceae bacterium]